MAITQVGTAAIRVMAREGVKTIGFGDLGLLDETYHEAHVHWCYGPNPARVLGRPGGELHPLDRHARILNTLERDHRFEKGFFRCADQAGRERLMRTFKLKEGMDGQATQDA